MGNDQPRERTIARDAGMVMALILLSRLLGFVRERAIADVFGLNFETDAFRLAFNIPDLMYFLLIAGGLNAAFIPVFTEYLAKEDEEEAWRLAWTFFTVILGLLIAMVMLGVIFTPQLTPFVAYSYRGEQRELLIVLMRMMFPAVFFTALAGAGMGIHKSYKNFAAPMWGPIVYNLGIIASTYTLGRSMGIVGMAYGTVLGAIGNFLIQLPFVWKKSPGFRFDLSHPGLRKVLRLMGPAVVSLSIFQVNFMIASNIASGLSEGSPTALRIGQTLMQLPLGVFAMAIGMVILPSLSRLMALGEREAFRDTFSQGLRTVFFITIPSGAGLLVLRVPTVRLLFETGEFTAADTEMAAFALLFFTFGLWAQSGIQILNQVYYSLQDTKTLVWMSLFAILFNTGTSLLLVRVTNLGHGALALAFSLTAIFNLFNYLIILRRKLGLIDGRRIGRTVLLSSAASAVMGIAVHVVSQSTGNWVNTAAYSGQIIQIALAVFVGIAVYGGLAYVFRMEELGFVKEMVKRRQRRVEAPQGEG